MWESRAAFGHDFSKRRWKSALFADFHGRGISIRQAFLLVKLKICGELCFLYPQIPLKSQIVNPEKIGLH
jgi:hypothetical protein